MHWIKHCTPRCIKYVRRFQRIANQYGRLTSIGWVLRFLYHQRRDLRFSNGFFGDRQNRMIIWISALFTYHSLDSITWQSVPLFNRTQFPQWNPLRQRGSNHNYILADTAHPPMLNPVLNSSEPPQCAAPPYLPAVLLDSCRLQMEEKKLQHKQGHNATIRHSSAYVTCSCTQTLDIEQDS